MCPPVFLTYAACTLSGELQQLRHEDPSSVQNNNSRYNASALPHVVLIASQRQIFSASIFYGVSLLVLSELYVTALRSLSSCRLCGFLFSICYFICKLVKARDIAYPFNVILILSSPSYITCFKFVALLPHQLKLLLFLVRCS